MQPSQDVWLTRNREPVKWFITKKQREPLAAGDLWNLIGSVIAMRWLEESKPTYIYELAWLCGRDPGTIRKALMRLLEIGCIKLHRIDGNRKLYEPTQKLLDWYAGKGMSY